MFGEVTVMSIVRVSKKIREHIKSRIASYSQDPLEVIDELHKNENITMLQESFGCTKGDIFAAISNQIGTILQPDGLTPFTLKHFIMLANECHTQELAECLNCNANNVLDALLDSGQLAAYLYRFDPEMVQEIIAGNIEENESFGSVENLLYSVLEKAKQDKKYNENNTLDFLRLFEDERFVKPTARVRLNMQFGASLKGSSSILNLVAICMEKSKTGDNQGEREIDTLGCIHLKQWIKWIVQQMIEEADENLSGLNELLLQTEVDSLFGRIWVLLADGFHAPAKAWKLFFEKCNYEADQSDGSNDRIEKRFKKQLVTNIQIILEEFVSALVIAGIKPSFANTVELTFGDSGFQPVLTEKFTDTEFPKNQEQLLMETIDLVGEKVSIVY